MFTEKLPPSDLIVVVTQRQIESTAEKFQQVRVKFIGSQFPIICGPTATGRQIYEQVWAKVRSMLQWKVQTRSNLWWDDTKTESTHGEESIAEESKTNQTTREGLLTPFVIKFVNSDSMACGLCHWSKRCYGCMLEPDNRVIYNGLTKFQYLACEWDYGFLEANLDPKWNSYIEHSSYATIRSQIDREKNIDECFDLFGKGDELTVSCERCQS